MIKKCRYDKLCRLAKPGSCGYRPFAESPKLQILPKKVPVQWIFELARNRRCEGEPACPRGSGRAGKAPEAVICSPNSLS